MADDTPAGMFAVTFAGHGHNHADKADPDFPEGRDINLRGVIPDAGQGWCKAALPYPTNECGHMCAICKICGARADIQVYGAADDPRSVTVPCIRLPSA